MFHVRTSKKGKMELWKSSTFLTAAGCAGAAIVFLHQSTCSSGVTLLHEHVNVRFLPGAAELGDTNRSSLACSSAALLIQQFGCIGPKLQIPVRAASRPTAPSPKTAALVGAPEIRGRSRALQQPIAALQAEETAKAN